MRRAPAAPKTGKASNLQAAAQCVCGAVRMEIDVPALWAWNDHSDATRRAHGGAYATYVGTWCSRFRILEGEEHIARYEDAERGTARSFCRGCGTPLLYERAHSPKVINVPRGLFLERTGREPRYHTSIDQAADWIWRGESMSPLKGYPGVMWVRPRKKKPGGPL